MASTGGWAVLKIEQWWIKRLFRRLVDALKDCNIYCWLGRLNPVEAEGHLTSPSGNREAQRGEVQRRTLVLPPRIFVVNLASDFLT